MKRLLILLLPALLCAGCVQTAPLPEPTSIPEQDGAAALLEVQLGLLRDRITDTERERALSLMERLYPLRQARLEAGDYEKSAEEERLIRQLNRLYERYTAKYLEDGGAWGPYESPPESVLAQYRISEGDIALSPDVPVRPGGAWDLEDFHDLWAAMTAMLPPGAYDDFTRFTVFTDGTDNVLAYVIPADRRGDKWEIAVDPADAGDGEWFTETVLHEYCHYLTLNDEEVLYDEKPSVHVYCEPGITSRPGSYLDDFYQAFWTGYLDDLLACSDSWNFFLRHEDDFVTSYAATDPSEDIAESFTYFVVWEAPEGDAVWEQKLNFFYRYPELAEFRIQVRECLGLS